MHQDQRFTVSLISTSPIQGAHHGGASAVIPPRTKGMRRWRLAALVLGGVTSVSTAVASGLPICMLLSGAPASDCLVINGNISFPLDENIPVGGQELPLTLNGNFGNWSVVLLEPVPIPTPGDPDTNSLISDVLIATGDQLLFGSDDANHPGAPGGLTPPPNAIPIPETGGFIDLTYLLPPGASFNNGGVVIPVQQLEVQSDVSAVPLPAALPLLGSGLLGLLGIKRRRTRNLG